MKTLHFILILLMVVSVFVCGSGCSSYDLNNTHYKNLSNGIDGTKGSNNPNTPFSKEPINLGTGNYFYQYQDLYIHGRGLPLSITRFYNSLNTYNGPFGYGWTFNYGMNLTVGNNTVSVIHEDGQNDTYVLNPNGTYTELLIAYNTLIKNPDDNYTLTKKDLTQYIFSSEGKLINIVDKDGNQINLTYTGGNLTTVSDASGREIVFVHDSTGHIISITDPVNRVWNYSYNINGDLVQCQNPMGGNISYTYDGSHHLTMITDQLGKQLVKNTYNSYGEVISQRNALGNTYTYNYDLTAGHTTEKDPFGKSKVYYFDSHLWETQETDQLGHTIYYVYDNNGNRISVTDENGHTTKFAYDSKGNVIQITDPLGNNHSLSYDLKNNLISMTDALGRQTSLEYNNNSDLTKITNALSGTISLTYDQYGQIINMTDANGNSVTYGYDANGNIITVTDALGNTTMISYDNVSRLTSLTDVNGNKNTFEYDKLNHLISFNDPLGHTATCTYDAAGNIVSSTDANGHTTNNNYDLLNRLVSTTNPLGYTSNFTYDSVGNIISFKDAAGNITTYSYDSLSRLVGVTDAMEGKCSYSYDKVGNLISFIDANGHTTRYNYDSLNRPDSTTNPLGNTLSNTYDAAGNMVNSTDPNGKITFYNYDGLNRLTQVSYANGQKVYYSYDANGNRLTMTDSHGTTNYEYDKLNHLISVENPDGQKVGYSYDGDGNLIKMIYPDGKTISYSYDAVNKLIGANDWSGHITGYSYDANGNLINMTYPNGMNTEYLYDNNDRLIELINKNNNQILSSYNYTLDSVGNRLKAVEFLGGIESQYMGLNESQTLTTTYEYDNLYRLTKVNYPSAKSVSYRYDHMGNRISMISTFGGIDSTVNYTYDAADHLLKAGNITYTYDKNGNLIGQSNNSQQLVTYSYDDSNMLKSVSAFMSGKKNPKYLCSYDYDGDGNRIISTTVNGKNVQSTRYTLDVNSMLPHVLTESTGKNTTTYTYGNNLISMNDPNNADYYYLYDGLGSVHSLSDSSGVIENIYQYDVFGQVQKEISQVNNNFLFSGEQMDADTGLIYLRARYYDPGTGRFLTSDQYAGNRNFPPSLNRYTYAYNNPVIYIDPSGHVALLILAIPGIVGGTFSAGSYVYETLKNPQAQLNFNTFIGEAAGGFTSAYVKIPGVGGAVSYGTSQFVQTVGQLFGANKEKFSIDKLEESIESDLLTAGVLKGIHFPEFKQYGRNAKNYMTMLTGYVMKSELVTKISEKIIETNIVGNLLEILKNGGTNGGTSHDNQNPCSGGDMSTPWADYGYGMSYA